MLLQYYWRPLSFSALPVAAAAAAAAAVAAVAACITAQTFTAYTRYTWTIECVFRVARNETTCSAACVLNAEKCVRVIYLCLASNAKLSVRCANISLSFPCTLTRDTFREFNQYKRIKSKNPTLLEFSYASEARDIHTHTQKYLYKKSLYLYVYASH